MDYYGFADYVAHPKTVGEEIHPSPAIVGEQYGKIAGVVAVGLAIWIPVLTGSPERLLRIAYGAGPVFMDMETVWTDGVAAIGGTISGKSGDINGYPYTAGHVTKNYSPAYARSERTAANIGYCHSGEHLNPPF